MKAFKYVVLTLFFLLIVSCKKNTIEHINLYVDKELEFLLTDIVNKYEKKNNVKINIKTDLKKGNLGKFDVLISNDSDILKFLEENDIKNIKENYEKNIFLEDEIAIIGRRKLADLSELLYSKISISSYNTHIGKKVIDYMAKQDFFDGISKKIEYKENSISALQSVDLYEVDYAIVGKSLLFKVKNSSVTYLFPDNLKIVYNIYEKKGNNKYKENFYSFLKSNQVKIFISKHQEIN